ncbi:MAG TPA: hypothetical protein VFS08_14790 [Gemmatimonadaceae bacterium]|nr:hypothetical protein [Gemmatimonadaceae bacterium]
MLALPPAPRRRAAALAAVVVAVSQLAACSLPFTKSTDERKAPCDRLAARAIQTDSFEEAKDLAAQASACYAREVG